MGFPAYVINLDRSPERLAAVTAVFADAGIRLERFRGIDARENSALIDQALDRKAFDGYMRRRAAPGEVGCALSHFALWDSLENGKHDCMLVLEDDCVPTEHILHLEELTTALPNDWDIVLLNSAGKLPLRTTRVGPLTVSQFLKPGYYATGYLVHRRILRHRFEWRRKRPVAFAFDAWRFWFWRHGFKIYTVGERLVCTRPEAASTIDASGETARSAPGRASVRTAIRAALMRVPLYSGAIWRGLARLTSLHILGRA